MLLFWLSYNVQQPSHIIPLLKHRVQNLPNAVKLISNANTGHAYCMILCRNVWHICNIYQRIDESLLLLKKDVRHNLDF